jgi:hypothetical protein
MNRAYRISPDDTAGQDFGANFNTSRSKTFTPRQIAIRQGMSLTGSCTGSGFREQARYPDDGQGRPLPDRPPCPVGCLIVAPTSRPSAIGSTSKAALFCKGAGHCLWQMQPDTGFTPGQDQARQVTT